MQNNYIPSGVVAVIPCANTPRSYHHQTAKLVDGNMCAAVTSYMLHTEAVKEVQPMKARSYRHRAF